MFGANDKRAKEDSPSIQVRAIFRTIQGEGPFSGQVAVFVRLTGCNLACEFCDTEWNDLHDRIMIPKAILEEVKWRSEGKTSLVVITGGEPTRQNLDFIIPLLLQEGFSVQVETSGSFSRASLWLPGVTVVVSPKVAKVHPDFLRKDVVYKYVIQGRTIADDGLPGAPTQADGRGGVPARPPEGAVVYLQPMDEYDEKLNRANLDAVKRSALEHGYIAGVQLHKILGVE